MARGSRGRGEIKAEKRKRQKEGALSRQLVQRALERMQTLRESLEREGISPNVLLIHDNPELAKIGMGALGRKSVYDSMRSTYGIGELTELQKRTLALCLPKTPTRRTGRTAKKLTQQPQSPFQLKRRPAQDIRAVSGQTLRELKQNGIGEKTRRALLKAGLLKAKNVETGRSGDKQKSVAIFYETTPQGKALLDAYNSYMQTLLVLQTSLRTTRANGKIVLKPESIPQPSLADVLNLLKGLERARKLKILE